MNYICKKCSYKTKLFSDIVRHINRKKTCCKKIDSFYYSEEDLIKLSLIQYNNDNQNIDISLLQNKNKNIIKKEKLFELLKSIEKSKLKECPLCNESFCKIIDLKNHLILNCISLDLTEISNKPVYSNTINNNIHNINNNTININITNNINNNYPISFDENWDSSHMSNDEKNLLILSMFKYTKTLEALLKNKINHNVIIDTESKSGLVYKNNKIEKMCLDEIIDKSFDKIFNHLNNFFEEVDKNNLYSINQDLLDNEKKSMKIKYDKYKYDNKQDAILHMTDSFNKVKDETLIQFNILNRSIDTGF
jgi:hypothetical protein